MRDTSPLSILVGQSRVDIVDSPDMKQVKQTLATRGRLVTCGSALVLLPGAATEGNQPGIGIPIAREREETYVVTHAGCTCNVYAYVW